MYGDLHSIGNDWPGMVNCVEAKEASKFTLPESLLPAAYKTLGGNIGAWRSATLAAAKRHELTDCKDLTKAWETGRQLQLPWQLSSHSEQAVMTFATTYVTHMAAHDVL